MPIVFVFAEPCLYTPIDRKPKSVRDWRDLRRVRNIETNGRVSVVVDEYDEDWSRLAWVRLEGVAEVLTAGGTAIARPGYSRRSTPSISACRSRTRRSCA